MKSYYAKITKQSDKKYLVEFPELDGCLTEGTSLINAIKNAEEALNGYLASHCDRNLNIPLNKKYNGRNYHPIKIDIKIGFAILLREIRMKKGLTQKDVAEKLGISQQAYAKLETPKSNPSLDTLKKISEAFDTEIDLKLVS
jgi:DNA-binding XRE family transcriptional regulator/predicted RNase H-like HicB family nuclease